MAGKTSIQWSEAVWNPVVGCTRVSAGCDNCYAFRLHDQRYAVNRRAAQELGYVSAPEARRFETDALPKVLPMPEQYDRPFSMVQLLPDRLEDPLHWRKPRHVFVDSMGDLFHEEVPDAYLDRVFAVMALAPQHTFQVLTKRPGRMREYLRNDNCERQNLIADAMDRFVGDDCAETPRLVWPLPNVWLGTSVEDQPSADARIPLLLQTPAAVRFLSCEPLLGPVNLASNLNGLDDNCAMAPHGINWAIVGGESGPRARVCDLGWIRDIVRECHAARVSAFVKQLGSKPGLGSVESHPGSGEFVADVQTLRHPHGGDPSEWPDDLQVREMPEGVS